MMFHKDGSGLPVADGSFVFVFGSNLAGIHAGGAARAARELYGAIQGQAIGRQGNSYGIPTVDEDVRNPIPLSEIRRYVTDFLKEAAANPEVTYLVTRIGCVIAGYSDAQIAPMFKGASENCSFAEQWKGYLI